MITHFTPKMLTGQQTNHLTKFADHHFLHPLALNAFCALQKKAKLAGFNLQPASTFRDFSRQQMIWNQKFNGLRPLLDHNNQPIDITKLDDQQRCLAILHWSALPGASRHHWGTDLDIYDPDLLPDGQKLQLEPWEYNHNGYFADLTDWLSNNMSEFGFYRPFNNPEYLIAVEPWHLSYYPLATQLVTQLTPKILLSAWQNKEIAGYSWLAPHLKQIFDDYIRFPSPISTK